MKALLGCVLGVMVFVFASCDLPGVAINGGDLSSASLDLTILPPDLAAVQYDLATGAPDLATTSRDLATTSRDLATAPPDLASAPRDLATVPPDLAMAGPPNCPCVNGNGDYCGNFAIGYSKAHANCKVGGATNSNLMTCTNSTWTVKTDCGSAGCQTNAVPAANDTCISCTGIGGPCSFASNCCSDACSGGFCQATPLSQVVCPSGANYSASVTWYCGTDGPMLNTGGHADPTFLYNCPSPGVAPMAAGGCANGCHVSPPGQNDCCVSGTCP